MAPPEIRAKDITWKKSSSKTDQQKREFMKAHLFRVGVPIFVVSRESIGHPRLRHVKHLLQGAGRAIFGSGASGIWVIFQRDRDAASQKHNGHEKQAPVWNFFVQENGTNKNPTPLNFKSFFWKWRPFVFFLRK